MTIAARWDGTEVALSEWVVVLHRDGPQLYEIVHGRRQGSDRWATAMADFAIEVHDMREALLRASAPAEPAVGKEP